MTSNPRDGRHDFDFLFGQWRIHNQRLKQRLAGCTDWEQFDAIGDCAPILGGIGNMDSFESDWGGDFRGMTLRLFDLKSKQWSLYWANSKQGSLGGPPNVGEFKNGRGEFFNQESLNGRAIYVRFVFSDITPTSFRFEQAFSGDGGKTWEVNWKATFTR